MMRRALSHRVWLTAVFIFALGLVIVTSTVSASTRSATTLQTGGTGVVNTGALNVREGPGVQYAVKAVVYQGYVVTLTGRNSSGSWVTIDIGNGVTGWVNVTLLDTNVVIGNLPVVGAPAVTPAATVATGALNVRSGPGVTYSVLTVVSYGQNVALLGRNNNSSWARIRTAGGTEGWVNASLLTPNVSIGSLPLAAAPAPPEPAVPVAPNALLGLRAEPSLSSSVVANVYQGQRVQAIGRNANSSWILVRIQETGQQGWISIGYIQLDVPVGNLPVSSQSFAPTAVPTATSIPATAVPATATPTGTTTPAPTATPTATPQPGAPTAVIDTGALNVRSGPGVPYEIVAIVYQNNTVTLLGRNADSSWAKIRTAAGVEGWVNVNYIDPNVPISSLPEVDAPTISATGTVFTDALNVRSGPGIGFVATAVVYQGTSFGLIGRNSTTSWIKVQLNDGHVGWVNAAYIQANITLNSLPVTN